MDPVLQQLVLPAVLPPPMVIGPILLAAWWTVGRRRWATLAGEQPPGSPGEHVWLLPILMGMASILVHHFVLGGIKFPRSSVDWLPMVAAVGIAMGATARSGRLPTWMRWGVRGIVAVLVALVMLGSRLWRDGAGAWSADTVLLWMGVATAATLAAWAGLERTAERTRGPIGPLTLMLWAGAVSQVLALGYASLRLATVVAVMASIAGALLFLSVIRPRFTLAMGGLHVPVLIIAATMISAMAFLGSPRPMWFGVLVMAAPALGLLADLLPTRRGWVREGARLGLMLAGLGAAVGGAVASMPEEAY